MKRITSNASAWYPCICISRINLCCLILGHSICALIASNTSMGFDLKKVHRVLRVTDNLYKYLQLQMSGSLCTWWW